MWKFFKMWIGIGILPLCWAVSIAIYQLYQTSVESAISDGGYSWAFPIGFLLWVISFFLLPRPIRTYVFGHELTHALWSILMGGRVGEIKVGKSGGHVELSKTNFIITLAPYFFPFYTFLVIVAYYLASLTLDVESYRGWWLGTVGLTWSFHLTFTVYMLSQRQSDVQKHGRIFSYAVIYTMNLLMIGIWMVLVGSPHFTTLCHLLWHEIMNVYLFIFHLLQSGLGFLNEFDANKTGPPEQVNYSQISKTSGAISWIIS